MIPFVELELPELVRTLGYLGIFIVVFLESGIPVGFFLPGDTLLLTAGLLAGQGALSFFPLIAFIVIAAILGDSAGYWLGKKFGRSLFKDEKSFVFSPKNLSRTEAFYQKHGTKAIILARFIPVVRTFVPILAGTGAMHYRTFISFNIIGGILWGAGVTFLGYALGSVIPDIEHYLLPLVGFIALVSFLPVVFEILKSRKAA